MDNTTKEIIVKGKVAIVALAYDILKNKQPSLQIDSDDYEITVWANTGNFLVKFRRKIRYIPMNVEEFNFVYDISVNIITKEVSPMDDWFNQDKATRFYIPTKEEKEKIKFIKNHGGVPYKGFDCRVIEEKDGYRISITNKHSFSKYCIDKITGEESARREGSYLVRPPSKNRTVNEDPLKEIFESTTQEEIIDLISVKTSVNPNMDKYIEITDMLSIKEFEKIKKIILKKGDRQTYRNFDNDNPHYHFDNFHAYLNSEIGQRNMNNDPEISDFNEITLHDQNKFDFQYYTLRIVRKRDTASELISVDEGMKEGSVYLLNRDGNDIDIILKNLKEHYLVRIRNQIDTH